jgi:hypothetical protein
MDKAQENWDIWLCPVTMTTVFTHRPKGTVIKINGERKLGIFLLFCFRDGDILLLSSFKREEFLHSGFEKRSGLSNLEVLQVLRSNRVKN